MNHSVQVSLLALRVTDSRFTLLRLLAAAAATLAALAVATGLSG
jgi:hypothetical protein